MFFFVFTSLTVSFSQCTNGIICTYTEQDLINRTGTLTINSGEILCIENSICVGSTSRWPVTCPNTNSISTINNLGEIRICESVTFEFSGSLQNSGEINQLGGNSLIVLNGTMDCVGGGVINCVTPGLSTCIDISGAKLSGTDICFNNDSNCPENQLTSYCPWKAGPAAGINVGSSCFLTGSPSTLVLLDINDLIVFDVDLWGTEQVKLSWEFNEASFSSIELLSSVDGIYYEKIKELQNLTNIKSGTYIHDTPHIGHNYYKMKMIENDGTYYYSNIRNISIPKDSKNTKFFPNPVKTKMSFSESIERLVIKNIVGETFFIQTDVRASVDLSHLPNGVYIVIMENDGNNSVDNFIKI